MSRVACIGECMVELSLPPDGVGEARLGFAGDTANVAIYLAREAGPAVEVAYVTALGDDKLSDRMAEFLAGHNLDVSLIERREGKAPGLYAISLDGKGERSFTMLKFRTMVATAEQDLAALVAENEGNGLLFKMKNDPRVTRIGRVLRKYSLDELPQLWNVFIGDMSLVGPRPCMERQRSLYGAAWKHYVTMRPGLTGLWQVSRRNELTFRQRVELDVEYVSRWSMGMDCRILLKTVRAVFVDGE